MGTTNETFQQPGKQDFFRHILKSSTSISESSDSQFFRTTTDIQLGPNVFDESRFIMTFLTILGVRDILQEIVKVIKIRILRKVFKKQFLLY